MQKTKDEIASSTKSSFGSMMMLVLSLACFIVFLWIVMIVVRLIVGLTV